MRQTALIVTLCWTAGLLACSGRPEAAKPATDTQTTQTIPQNVVDQVKAENYADVRIVKFPFAVQCWTYRKYSFFDTVDKVKALGVTNLQAFPGQALGNGDPAAVFDHNMSDDAAKSVRDRLEEAGLSVVAYGVVDIGTTEESMRKIFDFARKMGIRTVVCEPQDDDFSLLERLVKEYDLRIAIHNHPLPSKYAMPMTVFEHLQGRDERIGVCADTGHWMREGLNPVECLRLLQGRILDLHLKDRSEFGKGPEAVDVAWGSGKANVHDILAEMTLQDFPGFLTMEYENEQEVMTPEPAIRQSVAYVKGITYYEDYERLLARSGFAYEKHGWNHYGPGYFELDPQTGVLKSQGGMGLLWYSRKMFKDFVLELDYKCSRLDTNSGVFYRIPEMPSSDNYIYHSFEIQIDDRSHGIHHTGAVYDAEAPSENAEKPTGEWNHMKITCLGKRVQVEVNGRPVVDWEQEPRGKIKDFALEGYFGLQNHDSVSPVYFRNIWLKEL